MCTSICVFKYFHINKRQEWNVNLLITTNSILRKSFQNQSFHTISLNLARNSETILLQELSAAVIYRLGIIMNHFFLLLAGGATPLSKYWRVHSPKAERGRPAVLATLLSLSLVILLHPHYRCLPPFLSSFRLYLISRYTPLVYYYHCPPHSPQPLTETL